MFVCLQKKNHLHASSLCVEVTYIHIDVVEETMILMTCDYLLRKMPRSNILSLIKCAI